VEGECGCPRCWGHTKKSARAARPSATHPAPAALLCLRPARQDADYGRARWTSALPEPRQPSGCCVQALRDPCGQACWLREQPHPHCGRQRAPPTGCHAATSHCGQRPHTPTGRRAPTAYWRRSGAEPPQPTGRVSGHTYASGAASLPGAPVVTRPLRAAPAA
jgi:hypothetical protein